MKFRKLRVSGILAATFISVSSIMTSPVAALATENTDVAAMTVESTASVEQAAPAETAPVQTTPAEPTPAADPTPTPQPAENPTTTLEPSSDSGQTAEQPSKSETTESTSDKTDAGKTEDNKSDADDNEKKNSDEESSETVKEDAEETAKDEDKDSDKEKDEEKAEEKEKAKDEDKDKDKEKSDGEDKEKDKDKDKEDTEEDTAKTEVKVGTGSRVLVKPTELKNYKFWQIDKVSLFVKEDAAIFEEKDSESKQIGHIMEGGILYQIKDEGKSWLYVESGEVRGFIQKELLMSEEDAKAYRKSVYEEYGVETKKEKKAFDWSPFYAEADVAIAENAAYTYYLATTNQVVIDKTYGLLKDTEKASVFADTSKKSEKVGTVTDNTLFYIIDDSDEKWVYIESGDVRGFIAAKYVRTGKKVDQEVEANKESSYKTAVALTDITDNPAYYYSMQSTEEGNPNVNKGEAIVAYAKNYVGNPYVWGGTDLVHGADCSGFVQSIFRQYGYSLPRTASAQAQIGTAISIEDAQPGDLVFYQNAVRGIYHVAIYAGDGKTVEAQSSRTGIVEGRVHYNNLAWCVRVF